jgi:tRNA (guanine-N7-)-methyltransferase
VINERFIRHVDRTLAPGGSLHYWTDVEERFQETLALIAASSALAGPIPVAEKRPEHDLDYRTHFERRMRLDARPIYRAEFRKE